MTLAQLVADLDALRADYAHMGALVRGDRLLELIIAKLGQVDPDADPLEGPDLTTREAGRLLGLATKTVERLCRESHMRARKTSDHGEWRISRAALHEYRMGRRVRTPKLKLLEV